MKTKTKRARLAVLLAGMAVCLSMPLAIAAPPGGSNGNGNGNGGGGGGGGGQQDIPVCVTFDDAAGDLFRSDFTVSGSHAYCDGVDGIVAFIGRNQGMFRLATEDSSRQVVLDFPGCDDPSRFPLIDVVGGDCLTDAVVLTMNDQSDPGAGKLDLRTLSSVGATAIADFQIGLPSHLSSNTPSLIVFGGHNLSAPCGTPVLVTRTVLDPATWTIEAFAGGCTFGDDPDHPDNCGDPIDACDCACLLEVVRRNNKREWTDMGFALPFHITIEAQQ
ncbi:MAG: hypothetical protein ACYTGC_07215 [Planctomycetota bacterium]